MRSAPSIASALLIALLCGLVQATGLIGPLALPTARAMATADYCATAEDLSFLAIINDYRGEAGLGPLALSQSLGAAALHHSVDMATENWFAHNFPDGTTWSQNITNHGYRTNTYRGENLAAGVQTAQAAFDIWRGSPGHNDNMLGGNYNAIGIGRAYGSSSDYGWYWTTTFGSYVDAGAPACGANAPTATRTATPTATTTATATRTPTRAPQATATSTPRATATVIAPTATTTPMPTSTIAAAGEADLVLSKSSSKYNGRVVATLSGFSTNSPVTLFWPGGTVLAQAATDGAGSATATFRTPLVPLGNYQVTAVDGAGNEASTSLRVIPRILLNETTGHAGMRIRVYFYGFLAGERVDVRWYTSSTRFTVLKTVTIASNGRGTTLVDVPATSASGTFKIAGKVQGVGRSASTTFLVTGFSAAADETPSPTPVATESPTTVPTATATPTSTGVPTETPTVLPTPSPTGTPTPTATSTPELLPSPTVIAPATPDASPEAAATEAGAAQALSARKLPLR